MNEKHTCSLSAASIDALVERIDGYLAGLKLENKNRLRIRLSMEEMLLRWRDHFGEEAQCTLEYCTRFGRPQLSLSLPGEAFDPLSTEEEYGDWSARTLGNIGLFPIYSYEKGVNRLLLKLKKPKRNPILSLVISIAAALAVGFLGGLLPAGFTSAALDKVIVPVYDTFLGVLGAVAGPMVFLAVSWGIYSIGDLSILGRIGKRMLGRFLGVNTAMMAFAAAVCLLLFRLDFSVGGADGSQLWSIFQMILDIFPDNIISPFADGNSMQIILIAVLVGGGLLMLGKQTKAVAALIEQLDYLIQLLVEFISSLIPFFIFIVLVQMIWSDTFSVVLQAWKPFAVFLVVVLLLSVYVFLRVARKNGVSPLLLVKKCAETFIISLTTASSTAAFGTVTGCCEKKLGINGSLSSFGIPLGIVFYTPGTTLYFLIINFYMAEVYAVEISIVWVLIAIFISIILAIAAPPIPGGTLTCYTVMFLQLGIPAEGLAVALAIDVLFDFIATAINMVYLEMELTMQASRMRMINPEIIGDAARKTR